MNNQELNKYGRGGDSEIRKVDGRPSHVSLLEAYMIDNYGKGGERFAKEYGSGTVNPATGMPEYFDRNFWFGKNSIYGKTLGKFNQASSKFLSKGAHWIFPMGDSEWFGHDEPETAKMEKQATEVTESGMSGLGEELESYLSPGGFLPRQRDISRKGYQSDYDFTTEALETQVSSDVSSLASAKSGAMSEFGGYRSGTIERKIGEKESDVLGAFDIGGRKAKSALSAGKAITDLTYAKGVQDIRTRIQNRMNDLVMDYQAALGEKYVPGEEYNKLKGLLDQYS